LLIPFSLDFSLLQPDPDFLLDKYLDAIQTEFHALGMQVSIKEKRDQRTLMLVLHFWNPKRSGENLC
jgi:hypothetical protein